MFYLKSCCHRRGLGTDGGRNERWRTAKYPLIPPIPLPCSLCTHPVSLKLRHAFNDVMGARGPSLRSKFMGRLLGTSFLSFPFLVQMYNPMLTVGGVGLYICNADSFHRDKTQLVVFLVQAATCKSCR